MMKCPYCGEMIQDGAFKCRFCREWIDKNISNSDSKKSGINSSKNNEDKKEDKDITPNMSQDVIIEKLLVQNQTEPSVLGENGNIPEPIRLENVEIESAPPRKDIGIQDNALLTQTAHPWRRYFARMLDWNFILFSWVIVGRAYPPIVNINSVLLFSIIVLCLIIFEASLITYYGSTPGKWLLNIAVLTSSGKKLSIKTSLKRELEVNLWGLGLYIPIISVFTLISSYQALKNQGITKWDEQLRVKVEYGELNIPKVIIGIICFAFVFLFVLTRLENSKPSSVTEANPIGLSSNDPSYWHRNILAKSKLTILTPGSLKVEKTNIPESMESHIVERESYGYNSNGLYIGTRYYKWGDEITPSLEGAVLGSIQEMKSVKSISDFKYETKEISPSYLRGICVSGSFSENGNKWKFIQMLFVNKNNMWQIISVFQDNNPEADRVIKLIFNSIEIG